MSVTVHGMPLNSAPTENIVRAITVCPPIVREELHAELVRRDNLAWRS